MPPLTEQDVKRIYHDVSPVSRSDFKTAFDNVIRLVRLAQQNFTASIDEKMAELNRLMEEYSNRVDARFAAIKQPKNGKDADEKKIVQEVLRNIRQPKDGDTPIIDYARIAREAAALIPAAPPGRDADPKGILAELLAEVDRRVPLLGDALRATLELHVTDTLKKQAYYGGGGNVSVMRLGTMKSQAPSALNFKGAGAPTVTIGANGVTHLDFPAGSSATSTYGEVVSGSGTTFTLAATPTAGTVRVFANGQRLTITTDYSISGAIITTVSSWSAGAITADYAT